MKIKEFVRKHKRLKWIIKMIVLISRLLIMIPVMIPVGIVLNIRKIIYTPKSRETDSIGVLGRGVSLTEASRLSFLKDFIIVNSCYKELKIEPLRSLLRSKRIIHMVNILEEILPIWYLLKYNIYKYVVARFKPNDSGERLHSSRKFYTTEKFGFKTDLLPEEMDPYLGKEKGSGAGVIAVAYAAVALKKKNVYVVGMDFYETDYLTEPLSPKEFDDLRGGSQAMMKYVTNLIAKCPDTNFHFITASSFKCSLPNVRVYNIRP